MQAKQRSNLKHTRFYFWAVLFSLLLLPLALFVTAPTAQAAPRCREVLELHKRFSRERNQLVQALKEVQRVIAVSERTSQKKASRLENSIAGYDRQLENKARQIATKLGLVYQGSEYGITLETLLKLVEQVIKVADVDTFVPWACPLDIRQQIPVVRVRTENLEAEFKDDYEHRFGKEPNTDKAPELEFAKKQYNEKKKRYLISLKKSIHGLGVSLFDRCESERTLDLLKQGIPLSARQRNKTQRLMDKQRKILKGLARVLPLIESKEKILGAQDIKSRTCLGDEPPPLDSQDRTAPIARLHSPNHEERITGRVVLRVNASDNIGIKAVIFVVNGVIVGRDELSPYVWVDTAGLIVGPGPHLWQVRTEDLSGIGVPSEVRSFTVVGNDSIAPTCVFTSPAGGATVSGELPVEVSANDASGVKQVQLFVDENAYGEIVIKSPYSFSVKSNEFPAGAHTLRAEVTDLRNNKGSCSIGVTFDNTDLEGPKFDPAKLQPADNATIRGPVKFSAVVEDNVAVRRVEFFRKAPADAKERLIVSDAVSPYEYAMDGSTLAHGDYEWYAVAYDTSENPTQSEKRKFTIAEKKTVLTIVEPVALSLVGSTVKVTVKAEDAGPIQPNGLRLYVDGAEVAKIVDGKKEPIRQSAAPAEWVLSGLSDGQHLLRAELTDTDGVTVVSEAVSIEVKGTYVQIVAPTGSSKVSGVSFDVTIRAEAKDIVKVELLVDGVTKVTQMAPLAFPLTLTAEGIAEGTRRLVAKLTYDSTKVLNSTQVTVQVEPRLVKIESPLAAAELGKDFPVNVSVNPAQGIKSVQLLIDGAAHGPALTPGDPSPANYVINAVAVGNGLRTLVVEVTDKNDLKIKSAPVTVNVDSTRAVLSFDAPGSPYNFGSLSKGSTSELTLKIKYSSGTRAATFPSVLLPVLAPPSPVIFSFKGGSYPGSGGTCGSSISADCTLVLVFSPPADGTGGMPVPPPAEDPGSEGVYKFELATSFEYYDPSVKVRLPLVLRGEAKKK